MQPDIAEIESHLRAEPGRMALVFVQGARHFSFVVGQWVWLVR
jgi:hypothetical protein